MSQYGKRDRVEKRGVRVWEKWRCEIDGKNALEGTFCHNPGKKGWSFYHSYTVIKIGRFSEIYLGV
jgi:hypothetical protein